VLDGRDSVPDRGIDGIFTPPHNIQTGSKPYPTSYPMVIGGKVAGDVKLTTHLHLVRRLGMRGAIPPVPQYVSMAWCLVKQ